MSQTEAQKIDILIVDDQLVNLKILKTILSKSRFRIRPAISGPLALQAAKKIRPDLILLDVMMPDMDGYEVCQQLKADEETCDIPVIFISALGKTRDKIKAFSVGGVDYITKPFNEEEILARVKIHLSLRSMQTQLELKNRRLEQEITERRQAEEELKAYRQHLEQLVAERTAALENINSQLRQEITERRQTERALRQSEARYRKLAQENEYLLEQARRDAEAKTTLLNEVNHRVKNNISAVIGLLLTEQRYAISRNQPLYRASLQRLVGRIQGLSRVHNMLSAAGWTPLPLNDLVQQVSSTVLQFSSLPNKQTNIDITPTKVRITSEKAGSLALVINELVTNSIKHALPARNSLKINVSTIIEQSDHSDDAVVVLEYSDNGPGYPDSIIQNSSQQQGLGLYLAKNLVVKDLLGSLTLSNSRQGATATIRLNTPTVFTIPAQAAAQITTDARLTG